jgi:NitT/TauT family transport system permease protein
MLKSISEKSKRKLTKRSFPFPLNKIKINLISLILPVLFLLLWNYNAERIGNNAILPTVGRVLGNFLHAFDNFIGLGSIPKNIGYSMVRVLLGYTIGAAVAFPIGLTMGYFKTFRNLCENFISLFKPIPSIAWQPLVLGWFGVSSLARMFGLPYGAAYAMLDNFKLSMIFLIALGAFFPIMGNILFGVTNVRKVLVESAKVLGASQTDIFFHVLIPAAGPTITQGMRMGLTASWVCLVSAEMLPGSMSGVGYLITHAYELARMDLVITGMICIGAIGAFLDGIFRIIMNKHFSWQNKVK